MHLEIREFLINYLPSNSLPNIGNNVSVSYEDKTRDITEDDRDELTRFKSYSVCVIAGATKATLPEESLTCCHDLFESASESPNAFSIQPLPPPSPQSPSVIAGFIANRGTPIVNPSRPLYLEIPAVPTKTAKKRTTTVEDVYELQVMYLRGEMQKQKKAGSPDRTFRKN
ncbi:unnamed protein product [Mytilus coruscus]|uniref:Uncharacterized protein n=1 Tax=Mytilus coruscus TaxID=42192 RepID=A0A6J8BZB0_MYTCO|nr:unnamed protein product [Mytilus coruscus]